MVDWVATPASVLKIGPLQTGVSDDRKAAKAAVQSRSPPVLEERSAAVDVQKALAWRSEPASLSL